jgi:ABC transporter family protein
MDAVKVKGLTKRYGKIEVLRGVDLTVPEGTVFGLVGPSGSGKTTEFKALVGALRPSAGEVGVLGLNPLKDRAELRRQIGYMPLSPALYEDLSARSYVEFFGYAHRTPELAKRIAEVLAFSELGGRANDPVHTFSGGMKRRVPPRLRTRPQAQDVGSRRADGGRGPAAQEPVLGDLQGTRRGQRDALYQHPPDGRGRVVRQDRGPARGRIIAADAPRRILERGEPRLVVGRGNETEEKTIGGHPEDLAAALRPYGLAPDVATVKVEADTLESVVLSLIEKEEVAG